MIGGPSSSPSSRATRRRRRLGGLAAGTLLGAGALALPGVAAAPGGGASGTLHVRAPGAVGHTPHVGCDFRVDLTGFDGVAAIVSVSPQGRGDQLAAFPVGLKGGAGNVNVTLLPATLAALRPGPQGFHLEVEATTVGGTRKSAVIWADCLPATDGGGPETGDETESTDDEDAIEEETDGPGNSDGTPGDEGGDDTDGPGNSDGTPGGGNTNTGGDDDEGEEETDGPGNSDGTPGGGNTNTDGDDDTDDTDDTDDDDRADTDDVVVDADDTDADTDGDREVGAGEVEPAPVVTTGSAAPVAPVAPTAPFRAVLGVRLDSPAPAAVVAAAIPAPAPAPASAEAGPTASAPPAVAAAATLPRTGAGVGTTTVSALGLIAAGIALLRFRRRPEVG